MNGTFADAPKVSVVVPVYNVEKYLDKCVQSLVDQELKDIEIILVDDGSPDACPAMCDAWAQRDSRIRVVHKENSGLSGARNAGVAVARAPYVGFVDSDDYVAPGMYRVLYENIMETGSDLSICGMNSCYANKTIVHDEGELRVVSSEEALRFTLLGSACAVLRLYPVDLARSVPFPEGKTSEDAFTGAEFFSRSEKVVIDPSPLYYWFHRVGSISSTSKHAVSLDVIDAYSHTLEVVRDRFPSILDVAEFRLYWAYFTVLDKMLAASVDFSDNRLMGVVEYLRAHKSSILENPYVGRARKIGMRVLSESVALYKILSRAQAEKLRYFAD